MSESTFLCINCNYTNSLGISFSILFPSNQSCVSNSVQSTVCYMKLSTMTSNNSDCCITLLATFTCIVCGKEVEFGSCKFEEVNY